MRRPNETIKHSLQTTYRSRNRGQVLVELALSIPLVLLCLVSIIYFGRLFLIKQSVAYAAQEGARAASRLPDLSNPETLDRLRGFADDGSVTGPDDDTNPSPIYRALSAAGLLSAEAGRRGSLPWGARVLIDGAGSQSDRVVVTIEYPYGLFFNPGASNSIADASEIGIALSAESGAAPVTFSDFVLTESASAAQEVYQQ